MSVSLLSSVKDFLLFILHLLLTAVLGILAWAFWQLYNGEKLSNQYQQEGQLKTVTVTGLSTAKQQWADYLGNVAYVSFYYNGKNYTARYVQNPGFVNSGATVRLLYHPLFDAFRQPAKQFTFKERNRSHLIEWTSASLFSAERKWLAACVVITVAFILFLIGLLARIPGLSFVTYIGSFLFTLIIFVIALYITYDAYAYYRYYQHLKGSGQLMQVRVIAKDRYHILKDDDLGYSYTATVSFQNKEKEIPVSQSDYDRIEKGSQLDVYYDAAADDMMATDYTMNVFIFLFAGVTWVLLIIGVRGSYISSKKRRNAVT